MKQTWMRACTAEDDRTVHLHSKWNGDGNFSNSFQVPILSAGISSSLFTGQYNDGHTYLKVHCMYSRRNVRLYDRASGIFRSSRSNGTTEIATVDNTFRSSFVLFSVSAFRIQSETLLCESRHFLNSLIYCTFERSYKDGQTVWDIFIFFDLKKLLVLCRT